MDKKQPEKVPSGFYVLPIGFGIAYGLYGKGFLLPWYIEAAVLAMAWGIGSIVLNLWVWKGYVTECLKLQTKPSKINFIVLQTVMTGATIYVPAAVIIFGRKIFG